MNVSTDLELDNLWEHAQQLNEDELRVLNWIAEGLVTGMKVYGNLSLATDKRVWRRELAMELRDALVYLGADACSPPRK